MIASSLSSLSNVLHLINSKKCYVYTTLVYKHIICFCQLDTHSDIIYHISNDNFQDIDHIVIMQEE